MTPSFSPLGPGHVCPKDSFPGVALPRWIHNQSSAELRKNTAALYLLPDFQVTQQFAVVSHKGTQPHHLLPPRC